MPGDRVSERNGQKHGRCQGQKISEAIVAVQAKVKSVLDRAQQFVEQIHRDGKKGPGGVKPNPPFANRVGKEIVDHQDHKRSQQIGRVRQKKKLCKNRAVDRKIEPGK